MSTRQTIKILIATARASNRFIVLTLFLMFALFAFYETTHAENLSSDKSLKSYKLPPNLKKYFQDKYKDQMDMDRFTSDLQETPQGPRGSLHIGGHFKVKNIEALSGDKADRARAIAKAFLRDEAELLGLPDLNELREYKISTSKGRDGEYTNIYYTRYIDGLPLADSWAHIGIGPDESIVLMNTTLVPAPSQLYEAVTREAIAEEEARRIIEKDLVSKNVEATNLTINIKKYAVSSSPYVVWKANANKKRGRGKWEYVVDAFTGEIISKLDLSSRDEG